MKRYWVGLAAMLLALAMVLPVGAQDQGAPPPPASQQTAPPPPGAGQQDQGYGQYSAPDDNAQGPGPGQYGGPPPPGAGPNGAANGAADQSQSPDTQPGMARISYMNGDVSSQRGDNGNWVAVTVNTPVATGDRVATGQKSRAEIQLDAGDVLRMSDNATAKIANLNRTTIQVQVGQGLVTYNVLKNAQATSEIDTPNTAIHPDGPGEYRILVNSDAETQVTIRSGSADVSTPQGSTHVDQGQLITVAGTDNPEYKTTTAPGRDDWDSWNNDRNHKISSAGSWQKTDPYYTGSEDLDTYGVWSEIPDYGQVWTPAQGPGWAPYSSGRWVWEPYYGWTWVSYEPWGWAPYHYGRWFVYGGNWVWWPGPVVAYPYYYPVWAPAYVSFFGWGGGGWGVGIGFGFGWGYGRVGWLPCGPGDWYHPWYGRWGGGFHAVGVSSYNTVHTGFAPLGGGSRGFSNINEAFRNDRVRGGISSMAGNDFGRAAVSAQQERISAASFRQASMMTGRSPISPSRASYSPTGRSANLSSFHNIPSNSQHFFTASSRGNMNASHSFANPGNASRGETGVGANRNSGSGAQSNSNVAANRGSIESSRPGWHTFTPPSGGATNRASRGFGATNGGSRGGFSGAPANNGNWQHYDPSATQNRGYSRGYSQSQTRGDYGSYSRPPLNMRQPIMGPRGGSPGNGGYGGYSQPRGGNSAPRGNYGTPRGNSRPSGGGSHGGGGHSGGGHR
jgi:FecR protein